MSKIIKRAGEIIQQRISSEHNYCSLSLIGEDGYPSITTISISKAEGIKWLTFCTGTGAKADIIRNCDKAAVCINSNGYHIGLVGKIEQMTDPAVKKDMWYEGLKNHFSGYEDPNYCVLKFTTERYSLFVDWEQEKGSLYSTFGFYTEYLER